MANNEATQRGGSGLWSLAFIVFFVFLVLKLTSVIAWSWWWVVSPLLFALGLSIIGGFLIAFFGSIIALLVLWKNRDRNGR